MSRFADVDLMNVVMIYDRNTKSVLLQQRTKKWKGGCFPGGHLEDGETLYESCVREIREETGLTVTDLEPCGVVHWAKPDLHQELIFCYRTASFSGELLQCEEGINYWVRADRLADEPLTPWFRKQMGLFFTDHYTEFSNIYQKETGSFRRVYIPSELPTPEETDFDSLFPPQKCPEEGNNNQQE